MFNRFRWTSTMSNHNGRISSENPTPRNFGWTSTQYFANLTPFEYFKFILNNYSWKINWNFGADDWVISDNSYKMLWVLKSNPTSKKSLKKFHRCTRRSWISFCFVKTIGWTVQPVEFWVGPGVGLQVRWSNLFLVEVHPNNIYCVGLFIHKKSDALVGRV